MKSLFKYIGIFAILLFSFYYTEKMSNIVINNSSLMQEINQIASDYNITPVSAVISDNYITPGLNGYTVNVLKSYNNMKALDTFNSYYLEYDKKLPDVSLENNKDKIIKYGNKNKLSVSLLVQNNQEIIEYAESKNIAITRLVTNETINSKASYEQINNDNINFMKVENVLNRENINKNICIINNNLQEICQKKEKYLVEVTNILNNYNLIEIKDNIQSGTIILIGDNVNLSDFKILVRQILYQDLKIISLCELISEERE